MTEWTAKQVMFLDESAANECNADQKYGWSHVGVKAEIDQVLIKLKKWSICNESHASN